LSRVGRCVSLGLGLILLLFFLGLVETGVASPATAVVYYVEVDKLVYEVGEPVFVNGSYFVEGSSYTLVTFSVGFNSSTVDEKSFGDYGAVNRVVMFCLDPFDWSPGVNGSGGWAKVFVEAADSPSDPNGSPYASDSKTVFFTVVRAGQNCSLKYVYPDPPVDNSSVALAFRLFNEHNSSFSVVNNGVSFSVFSPNGSLVSNGSTVTNLDGEFVVEFDPNGFSGNFTVEIYSFENEDYEAGWFTFVIEVSSGLSNFSKPTRIELEYDFIGNTVVMNGQNVSYALEPVRVFVKLLDDILNSPISSGEIYVFVFDWRNVTVFNVTNVTNGSGVFEFVFSPPYSGNFSVFAEFLGNETFGSSNCVLMLPEFLSRPLIVEVVRKFPDVVYVGEGYWVLFRVVDNFTGMGVSGVNVSLFGEWPMQFPLEGFAVTNDSGYSEFQVDVSAVYANVLPGYRHVAVWFMDTRVPVVYGDFPVVWGQLFREVSLTSVYVNCSEVLKGSSVMVDVDVYSDDGVPLNGSVQVYWDGFQLFNVSLFNGSGVFLLNVSFSESVGFHVLNVTFNEANYDISFCNVSVIVDSMFDVNVNVSSLDVCRGENCSFEIFVLDVFDCSPVSNVTVLAELDGEKTVFSGLTDSNGSVTCFWYVLPDFQPGIHLIEFNISKKFYFSSYFDFSIHVWIRTTIVFNVTVSEDILTQELSVKTVEGNIVETGLFQGYNYTSATCCLSQESSVGKRETLGGKIGYNVVFWYFVGDDLLILLFERKKRRVTVN